MDFTIRNLPAPVLEDLERAARLNGRSVSDEAIARLAQPTSDAVPDLPVYDPELRSRVEAAAAEAVARRPPVEELLARIRTLREESRLPPLTPEFLEWAKNEGRA